MSLVSNLKDKDSLIKKMFDSKFDKINIFLKEENEKLKNLTTIIPSNELKYPWSNVGHITEYLLALHIGLHIEKLFPMQYLNILDKNQYEAIKLLNITKKDLESEKLHKIISTVLYHLSSYESEIRTKGNEAVYDNKYRLSNVATEDIVNIYKSSLKKFSDGKYFYNPTFDEEYSKYIGGADADLIKIQECGNTLIDVKTTKIKKIDKSWIFQLFGYVAVDKEDKYKLKNISLYLPRQSKLLEYNIEEILKKYTTLKSINELRNAFGYALITQTFPELMEEKNIIRINIKNVN